MAASSNNTKKNGHQCEFLTQPSKELLCKSCEHVARDLTMTVCCSQHFCHECITPLQDDSKPCPGCGEDQFGIVPHVRHRKSIMALEVSCTMKERGCNWTGKLEDLASHTDDKNDNCQYVDVECPNQCAHPVPRCAVEYHLKKSCPKRKFNCEHCGFTETYEVINNEHYLECALYPIPCPNSCRIGSIEQGKLHEHLKTCLYQQMECEVPGCNGKFLREDSDMHMETNAIKHISLMSAAMRQMSADFDSKLREQESQLKERERETEEELEKKGKENSELKQELYETKAKAQTQIEKLQKEIAEVSQSFRRHVLVFHHQSRLQAGDSPHHFTIYNFDQRKKYDHTWHSPTMYVCNGPKIGISLRANGSLGTNARGTHVSVVLWTVIGESDDKVHWPVRCSVAIELCNQHRKQDHWRVQRGFQWEKPKVRQIAGHFGNLPNEHQFISHADLGWNPQKQTQYLKENTLHLVVVRIEAHSRIYLRSSDREDKQLYTTSEPQEKTPTVTSMQ